jgi:hypothetical protein
LKTKTLNLEQMKIENENLDKPQNPQLNIGAVSSRFVNVKLRRYIAEGMISTYEFLVWNNVGEQKKECQRILKALKKALS